MKLKIPSKYLESDTQIFRWDFHISHYFIFNLILIPQGSIRPCKRSVSIIRIRTRSIIFPFSGTILIKSLIVQPFLIHNNQRRLRILRRCFRRIFCPLIHQSQPGSILRRHFHNTVFRCHHTSFHLWHDIHNLPRNHPSPKL